MNSIKILATGMYLPKEKIDNKEANHNLINEVTNEK